jgi:uncharacterized membrane protein YgdD (TMEM256/DUF423 family)
MNLAKLTTQISLLSGALAVLAAALGAHALAGAAEASIKSFDTASRMHLIHSILLLVLSLWWGRHRDSRLLGLSCVLILGGMLLFSGGIYLRVFSGETAFSKLAPAGGILLIAGWIAPVFAIPTRKD